MKVRLTQRALADLEAIAAAIQVHNPAAARRVGQDVQRAFQPLEIHPHVGRAYVGGRRRFALRRSPYLIFYRIDAAAQVVEMTTIRHGAREPEHS